MDYETMYRELQEHRAQSQNLSKLLLKKQGAVLELQAERSALKSRLVDLQARYLSKLLSFLFASGARRDLQIAENFHFDY